MAFNLNLYPVVYTAKYNPDTKSWDEAWLEQDKVSCSELAKMRESDRREILEKRNQLGFPAFSLSSQYGYSVFEGLKAFSQKNGAISIFRAKDHGSRFYSSIKMLYCPPFPKEQFLSAVQEFVRRNAKLGYIPQYNPVWEENSFADAETTYIRPVMFAESGIGLGVAKIPQIVIAGTTVTSYYKKGLEGAVISDRIRATPHGTGYIKVAANYLIPALAKKEAEDCGYAECLFLDSEKQKYFQEASASNVFFVMKDGTLVTPELNDTVISGIIRKSVISLAQEAGIKVEVRKISVKEVFKNACECFLTGTAVGLTAVTSITDLKGKKKTFRLSDEKNLSVAEKLGRELKNIQFGISPDNDDWNLIVE